MTQTIGTCGACGGPVTVPSAWMGLHPPRPQCRLCQRQTKPGLPVLEMVEPVKPSFPEFTPLLGGMRLWRTDQ